MGELQSKYINKIHKIEKENKYKKYNSIEELRKEIEIDSLGK